MFFPTWIYIEYLSQYVEQPSFFAVPPWKVVLRYYEMVAPQA